MPSEGRVSVDMGELIRRLGHDLRNKFSVMKNSVYFLTLKGNSDDVKVSKHLGILEREIEAANRMVMDLMTYAWPKSMMRHDLKINRLLKRAVARASLPERVARHLDLSPEVPLLRGDQVHLEHALTNLIGWAAQASPGVETILVSSRARDGRIEVRIVSDGVEPLRDLDNTLPTLDASAPEAGLLLSLIVGRSLIEAHGATLDISRRDGDALVALIDIPC